MNGHKHIAKRLADSTSRKPDLMDPVDVREDFDAVFDECNRPLQNQGDRADGTRRSSN